MVDACEAAAFAPYASFDQVAEHVAAVPFYEVFAPAFVLAWLCGHVNPLGLVWPLHKNKAIRRFVVSRKFVVPVMRLRLLAVGVEHPPVVG